MTEERKKLMVWMDGQTWSENYNLADWHLSEIKKAKRETALIIQKESHGEGNRFNAMRFKCKEIIEKNSEKEVK
jgi:hypothetical protein